MCSYVIGVDAGGTKTSACAFSPEGELLAQYVKGPALFTADAQQAQANVLAAIDACRAALSMDCAYIAVGAAGLRGKGTAPELAALLREKYRCPAAAVDDGLLALYAKLRGEDGVLVIAGTGSVACAKAGRDCLCSGGWGMLLDDRGSGTAIALEALRRLLKRYDTGVPLLPMDEALLRRMDCASPVRIPGFVYGVNKAQIAALAPVVMEYAEAGCGEANSILTQAGEGLAAMSADAPRRLGLTAPRTAASGSILEKCAPVRQAFWRAWSGLFPGAVAVHSNERAEKGALWFYRENKEAEKVK